MVAIQPSKDRFLESIRSGIILPLHQEIPRGELTPLDALYAVRTMPNPVLLESARVHEKIGRYSFVTADPYLIFRSRGDTVELSLPATPRGKYGKRATMNRKPLAKAAGTDGQLPHAGCFPDFRPSRAGPSASFPTILSISSRRSRDAAHDDLGIPGGLFPVRRPGGRLRPSPEQVLGHREPRRARTGDGVSQARAGPVGRAVRRGRGTACGPRG